MPIQVTCPGCFARFAVSEKFAGKQGPCPKCKAIITIPKPDAVIVHEPAAYGGVKDAEGKLVLKPIERNERKITPLRIGILAGGVVGVLAASFVFRDALRAAPIVLGAGLALLSPVLVAGAYLMLRDDDRTPYRGKQLWLRSCICGLIFAAEWGAYALLPPEFVETFGRLLVITPPFIVVGTLAASLIFELDFGNGFFAFAFYLAATMLLRWALGMPAVWEASTQIVT